MKTFLRMCLVLITFAYASITSHAQLVNGGFETAGTNLIYQPDANGVIITNTSAASWNVIELGFRTATNSPASGTYTEADFGQSFPGINTSGSTNTAHSGGFSLRAFGPFPNLCCTASGAFQVITNSGSQAVSNNQIWVMNGYALNWSGDPMFDFGPGVVNFGLIQIQFLDSTGTNVLGTVDGAHLSTNMTVDTWISCTVTATAPVGTTRVAFYALHVGMSGAEGSIFFDDLSVTNIGVAPPPPPPVALEPAGIRSGVQVCWPTTVGTSYQPQYSEDNANWVNIISTNAAQQLLPGDGTTNCIFTTRHNFYRVQQTSGTSASLLNPGFETPGATYINGTITNTSADSWTQFNNGFRSGTNNTLFGITAHSGAFSMQTYGPFSNVLDASGAYQDLTASAGQNWRLTGYCLNWQNDKLSGPDGFGVAQLQFLDSTNGVIATVEGSRFGTDVPFPLDTWQFFEVDATNAPGGTAKVRAQVLHVGKLGDNGSVWWDDLTIYQPIGSSSAATSTNQPAVQVYWPTAPPTNGISYQVQSITNLVFTNLPPVNALTNAGFEANAVSNAANNGTIPGWTAANGGSKTVSSYPNPTHSGIGALRLFDSTTAVPVVFQGNPTGPNPIPAAPGQVWDLTGYAYVSSADSPIPNGNGTFGLYKFIWIDSSGALLQPLTSDTNAIGTIVTGGNAGIESAHITSGTPQNSWIPLEARATAPPNTAYIQALEIVVGFSPGGAVRFDDVVLTQAATTFGWKSFGPVIPGNGQTNQVFDPIGSNTQKFYRVFTP